MRPDSLRDVEFVVLKQCVPQCCPQLLTVDILLVSLEGVHLLHGPDVIHLDQMVSGCS